jgi:hypothetical protein
MPLRSKLTTKVGRVFTRVTAKLEGSSTVRLLKPAGDYNEYDTLLVLTSNLIFEFSEHRRKVHLEIGRDDDELTEAITEATHFDLNGHVWAIDKGDTHPPSMADVTWKLTGDIFEAEYQPL